VISTLLDLDKRLFINQLHFLFLASDFPGALSPRIGRSPLLRS
jgi:hypothetical protein